MNKIYGIILTLTAGLFFLIGGLISSKVSNKDKLNNFSIALAFIIMLSLVLFDLFPENLELLEEYIRLREQDEDFIYNCRSLNIKNSRYIYP